MLARKTFSPRRGGRESFGELTSFSETLRIEKIPMGLSLNSLKG